MLGKPCICKHKTNGFVQKLYLHTAYHQLFFKLSFCKLVLKIFYKHKIQNYRPQFGKKISSLIFSSYLLDFAALWKAVGYCPA